MIRSCTLASHWLALSLAVFSSAAQAQSCPNKVVRLVVPYAPGGGADTLARLLAGKLGELLKQNFIVENKPGANTMLATEHVIRQPPDGCTLLYVDSALANNPAFYKLGYSGDKDLAPVALVARIPLILVAGARVPVQTVPELLVASKKKPGSLSYASYGQGSSAHLAGALMEQSAGIRLLHVPYKGGAQAMTDLLGGQVDLAFLTIPSVLKQEGKIQRVAVTSASRVPAIPEVPTVAETLPGFDASGWNGIVAPAGTPPEAISRLNEALNAVLRSTEMTNRYRQEGLVSDPQSPQAFAAMIAAETRRVGEIVRKAGITVH